MFFSQQETQLPGSEIPQILASDPELRLGSKGTGKASFSATLLDISVVVLYIRVANKYLSLPVTKHGYRADVHKRHVCNF